MLSGALAGLVAAPLTEIQTAEQMRAATQAATPPDGGTPPAPAIPPEVQVELVHDMLELPI